MSKKKKTQNWSKIYDVRKGKKCLLFLKYILLIMLSQLSQFSLFAPLLPVPPFPPVIPLLVHAHGLWISSLASPFPILFLTSPCLFCTYQLCFLIPAPFPLFVPFSFPADNPPHDFHIYDSVPVLIVCLVCFFLHCVVDNCKFIAILIFIVLIFFFLNKSL